MSEMAWESPAEEVMSIVGNHMAVMDLENRVRMCERFTEIFFPNRLESWGHAMWVTHWGVTFVTMWNEEHLMRNINYAMLKEHMGVGPRRYCILSNMMPHFEARVLTLLRFLPRRKMCFYPRMYYLDGVFQRPPWRREGRRIMQRRIRFRHTVAVSLYMAQQMIVYFITGFFEPSFTWV